MQGSQEAVSSFYYSWDCPGNTMQVLLSLRLLDVLQPWMEANGQEVGGVLLGRIEQEEYRPTVIRIDDYEPVTIEHQRGPTYSLSEKEKEQFGKHIARGERRGLAAVGLMRSHRRRGLYLDTADAALFDRYFSGLVSVFLVARPGFGATAGFFFREGDELRRHAPYAPFPFDREILDGTRMEPAAQVAGGEQAEDGEAVPPGAPRLWIPGKPALVWVSAAVVAAVLGAGIWQQRSPKQRAVAPPAPPELGLGLSVASNRNELRLRWNPRSPLIERASGGTLSITDGLAHQELNLSRQELAKGGTAYTPASGEVNFVLEVRNGRLSSRESIQSVDETKAEEAALQEPEPIRARPAPEPPQQQPAAKRVETPVLKETPHAVVADVPVRKRVRPVKKSFVAASQPAVRETPENAVLPSEPLPVETAMATPLPLPLPVAAMAVPAGRITVPPPALKDVTYEPAPDSKLRKAVSIFSPIKRRGSDEFVPAKAVHEVQPEVPASIAKALPAESRVDFLASVDRQGRVTDVELRSPGVDHRIVGLADIALRHWRFAPAESKGHAVPSRLVVTFRFANTAPARSDAASLED